MFCGPKWGNSLFFLNAFTRYYIVPWKTMFHSRDSPRLLVCDTGLYLEQNDIRFITVAICGGYISKYPGLKYFLGLFLDFSKAFDTVNHDILFTKLDHLGVRNIALQWFKSYLSSSEQYVVYNNSNSSRQVITCGVPQGSTLGPLLSLLYINDLANASSVLFSLFFADDSNMFLSG